MEPWYLEFGNFAAERQFEVLEEKFQGLFAEEGLVEKINGATVLLGELSELNQRYAGKPWTLVFICKAYHVRVECELGPYLAEPGQLGVAELLRLHDFISAYNKNFSNNLCASVKEELPPNTFPCYEETLRKTYSSTLESSMRSWVSNISSNVFKDDTLQSASLTDLSKAAGTSAPVDLLRIVCETLTESSTGGNSRIEEVATSCCVTALGYYLDLLQAKLPMIEDIALLCALANDCSTIVDYVDSDLVDVLGRHGVEAVSTKYTNSAVQIIEIVVGKILLDLDPWISLRFEEAQLRREDRRAVSNVCVIIKDSLADLKILLQPFLFQKLRRLLSRKVMIAYFSRLLNTCGHKPLTHGCKVNKLSTEEIGRIVADRTTFLDVLNDSRTSPWSLGTVSGQDVFVDIAEILTQPPQNIELLLNDLCQAHELEVVPMLLVARRCIALRSDMPASGFQLVSKLIDVHEDSGVRTPTSSKFGWSTLLPDAVRKSLGKSAGMSSLEIGSKLLASLKALRKSIQSDYGAKQDDSDSDYGEETSPEREAHTDVGSENDEVDEFISVEEDLILSAMRIAQLKEFCKESGINTMHCLTRSDLVAALKAEVVHVDPGTLIKALLVKVSVATGVTTSMKVKVIEYAVRLAANDNFKVLEAKGLHALGILYLSIPEKLKAAPVVLHMAADIFFAANEVAEYESSLIDAAKAYQCMGEDERALSLLKAAKTASDTISMATRIATLARLNTPC